MTSLQNFKDLRLWYTGAPRWHEETELNASKQEVTLAIDRKNPFAVGNVPTVHLAKNSVTATPLLLRRWKLRHERLD